MCEKEFNYLKSKKETKYIYIYKKKKKSETKYL